LIPEQIEEIITWNSFRFFVGGIADAVLGEKLVLYGEKQLLDEHIYSSLDKYQKPKEVFILINSLKQKTEKIKEKKC
jgi:O-succinylbenzoic acid--CoA ligase